MLITAEPKKFSLTFKGEEIKMVLSALKRHRSNPGTVESRIRIIDNLIKQHNMFPKNRIMTVIEIKAIIYGIALLIAETTMTHEELDLGLSLISAMNNAMRQNDIEVPYPVPFYIAVPINDNR